MAVGNKEDSSAEAEQALKGGACVCFEEVESSEFASCIPSVLKRPMSAFVWLMLQI